MSNQIKISGTGILSVKPDMMELRYEIFKEAPTYLKAFNALKSQYDYVSKAFKRAGFNVSLVKTSRIDVQAIQMEGEQPLVYRASQSLSFKDTIDLERMSKLLDDTRPTDVFNFDLSYFLKDQQAAYDNALILAINHATDKAKVIAETSGIKLGRILEIEDVNQHEPMLFRRSSFGDYTGSRIYTDDVEIIQHVSMTWEIK